MKYILPFLFLFPSLLIGQTQANLLYNWDDPDLVGSAWYNNTYNEVWGIVANNREFAVIGSTSGTHIFDVTDVANVYEAAFVPGAVQGPEIVHRDYHDYQCYLYAVADEGINSTLQIIDYSYLPDSVSVVYDSNEFFYRSHNIFIDTSSARLYASPAVHQTDGLIGLRVLSLDDPENPTLLHDYQSIEGVSVGVPHDLYVKENIAYINKGGIGFWMVDFTDAANPVFLGTLTEYVDQGYNHSGWLSDDGNYFYMADENHGLAIKILDVSDPTDIQVLGTFDANSSESNSIPHNLIVRGDYLYVSYYYDGLQVYDISDPTSPQRVYFYDTFAAANDDSYRGAWGVFPYLPSGNILISDMQTGLYVFEKIDNSITGEMPPLGTSSNCGTIVANTNISNEITAKIFPQPFHNQVNISFELEQTQVVHITLTDINGRVIQSLNNTQLPAGLYENTFNIRNIAAGMYFIKLTGETVNGVYKVVKA